MIKLKFVHHHEVTYATGPVNGPVKPDDVVEVEEAEAELLLRSGWWGFADESDEKAYAKYLDEKRKAEEKAEADQKDMTKGGAKQKQAIAKAAVTKDAEASA
jgi:hypothetical protein